MHAICTWAKVYVFSCTMKSQGDLSDVVISVNLCLFVFVSFEELLNSFGSLESVRDVVKLKFA